MLGEPRLMEQMTVREVREARVDNKTVVIPVGCLEQHGYHLPLNTDTINAYEIAKAASRKTGCFVAAPITYSFSGGTLPGTVDLTPQVFSLMLQDICQSFYGQGFINIVILLGHAGTENTKAAYDAADMFLRRSAKDAAVAVVPFFELSPLILEEVKKGDFHAGYVETSLMLHWYPALVRSEIIMDEPELAHLMRTDQDAYQVVSKAVENQYVIPHITQKPEIQVGVMGYPQRATAEFGKQVFEELVENFSALIHQLNADRK